MENAIARPRLRASIGIHRSAGRLARPHRRLARPGRGIPLTQDRPAAARQSDGATGATPPPKPTAKGRGSQRHSAPPLRIWLEPP